MLWPIDYRDRWYVNYLDRAQLSARKVIAADFAILEQLV
jgi:hypothetical protein